MKKLAYLIVLMFTVSAINAQNYNGVEIIGTLESPDPDFQCATTTGTTTWRLFRDAVPSNCPQKACPGELAGGPFSYVTYTFQNLLNQDQCITVNHNIGTCTVPHGFAILGDTFDPTAPFCNNNTFLGDVGSSVSQPYSFEVPAQEFFTIIIQEVSAPRNCQVGFTIEGDVGCAGGEVLKPLNNGTSVPTMTQWGLFLFGLIVLTLGVVYVYNMSVRTSEVEK